jgi:hypothetical protein
MLFCDMPTMVGMGLVRFLLYAVLAVVVASLVAVLVLWRVLRRRLRVHPSAASIAPLTWTLPTGQAAQAHRRLRVASQAAVRLSIEAGANRREPSEFAHLGESLAQHSVGIERDLVKAAKSPRVARRTALAAPIQEVERLEATVAELLATSAEWRQTMAGSQTDPLLGVQDRLAAMRHATDVVRSVDQPLSTPVAPSVSTPTAGTLPTPTAAPLPTPTEG